MLSVFSEIFIRFGKSSVQGIHTYVYWVKAIFVTIGTVPLYLAG